ncbi:MAG: dihydroorotate dehydrogenase electron transfer subunit [Deltaproteobacteria bacterium]|nr:dihydroorotate dehydrogenase electron transfer subunit [Deltaproteobacteria bacterium]
MSRLLIRNLSSELIKNEEVALGIRRLTLSLDGDLYSCAPGRFVMVRASSSLDPLLGRAFSVHDYAAQRLSILYRVAGRGTEWISRRKPGERLNLTGPLGTGFDVTSPVRKAVLIAGGVGVAPFRFLARTLRDRGVKVILFYGARTAAELVPLDEFAASGMTVLTATDDGSLGEPGTVTELFREHLRKTSPSESVKVYACGPRPMLLEVARMTRGAGIDCEVSLESVMACGLGTCMGCVIRTTGGYRRVCREGPVFDAGELLLHDIR